MKKNFQQFRTVLQLYIELENSKPKIWRRVQVPVDYTFAQLHQVIQKAFGWEDQHLHLFNLLKLTDHGVELVQLGVKDNDFDSFALESLDENEYTLEDELELGMNFEYHYDFGDDWIHDILVEGVLIQGKKQKYPVCLAGENHHAFEDIGGVYGYQHALEVLNNPQHKELKSWLKDCYGAAKINKFDPAFFDPKKIKF